MRFGGIVKVAPQHSRATYFLDENLEGATLEALLAEASVAVVPHRKLFSRGARDEDWIPKVAKHGYVIVTKDVAIKTKPTQRALIEQYKTTFLFLRVPMAQTAETASLLIMHYEGVCNHVRKLAPPIILAITKTGLHKELGERRGGVKR